MYDGDGELMVMCYGVAALRDAANNGDDDKACPEGVSLCNECAA